MPIVYQYEHPDYGWVSTDLDGIIDEFRNELEANHPLDGERQEEVAFKVRIVEMTQEEIDNMPEIEM